MILHQSETSDLESIKKKSPMDNLNWLQKFSQQLQNISNCQKFISLTEVLYLEKPKTQLNNFLGGRSLQTKWWVDVLRKCRGIIVPSSEQHLHKFSHHSSINFQQILFILFYHFIIPLRNSFRSLNPNQSPHTISIIFNLCLCLFMLYT